MTYVTIFMMPPSLFLLEDPSFHDIIFYILMVFLIWETNRFMLQFSQGYIRRDQASEGIGTHLRICYGREIPFADSAPPSWPADRGCYAQGRLLHT